jgi:leader peptidase (prepilin peptidase)/N-methyltransferase
MAFVALFILGLIFGSFLNAVAWRLHAGKSFVRGRSQCDQCGHTLSARDLVPVFSWLAQKGRCRYCQQKISWQHPTAELLTSLAFVFSYLWWPESLNGAAPKVLFVGWLMCLVGLVALAIYDLNWMLLPNKLIYPTLLVAVAARGFYVAAYELRPFHALLYWGASLLVASGFFWLLFMVSRGRWIGYGDVRLGLVTGTLLASPSLSFMMIFLASLAGSLIAIPLLAYRNQSLGSRLPYGPFLIGATFFVMLFGQTLLDWYNRVVLG